MSTQHNITAADLVRNPVKKQTSYKSSSYKKFNSILTFPPKFFSHFKPIQTIQFLHTIQESGICNNSILFHLNRLPKTRCTRNPKSKKIVKSIVKTKIICTFAG